MLVVAGVAGSGVTDAQTTVLYALSTFAQTCAALAAFVGAVGLYKLRLLPMNASGRGATSTEFSVKR